VILETGQHRGDLVEYIPVLLVFLFGDESISERPSKVALHFLAAATRDANVMRVLTTED
jgi:hypothetical protein